jgi:HEAT repeats
MSTNERPRRPNLEHLRKQAKDLLKGVRAGNDAAIQRLQIAPCASKVRPQLANTLTVIAREYGFRSWAKLKTYVETVAAAAGTREVAAAQTGSAQLDRAHVRPQRRGPRQMPSVRYLHELSAAVAEAAAQGDPYPFIFAPPLGPLRRAVQSPLREALVASGNLPMVVDILLRGAEHPNPRIRFECAHAMDWLADERCLPILLRLVNDPVPRVRWIAMHSLVCDDCKLTPLPSSAEVLPLLTSKATSDPNARVRRQAHHTLRLLATTG